MLFAPTDAENIRMESFEKLLTVRSSVNDSVTGWIRR